jgi:hypothetical protein
LRPQGDPIKALVAVAAVTFVCAAGAIDRLDLLDAAERY